MFSTSAFVQIYLDTSAILRFSQLEKPANPQREMLVSLYNLQTEGMIAIFTAQGSMIDIFGERDEKIVSDRIKEAAFDREKTRMIHTFQLAADILESNDDFDENDIGLFNILFNAGADKNDIYEKFINLKENDRTDYQILREFFHDSNNISYFVTANTNDFVKNGKKDKLEKYAAKFRKLFKIRDITEETVLEIKNDIEEFIKTNKDNFDPF